MQNEELPLRFCQHNRFYFGCGCGGEVTPKIIWKTFFRGLSLTLGHIISLNGVNQSLFLVNEFRVRKNFLKVSWFGCLLLNDKHVGG